MPLTAHTATSPHICEHCHAEIKPGDPARVDTGSGKRPRAPRFFCSLECARPQGKLYEGEYSPLFAGSPQRVRDPGAFKPPRMTAQALAMFDEVKEPPKWEDMRAAHMRKIGRPLINAMQTSPTEGK